MPSAAVRARHAARTTAAAIIAAANIIYASPTGAATAVGDADHPVTVEEAVRRAGETSLRPVVRLLAGTYAGVTELVAPAPIGNVASNALFVEGVESEASGLGTRTVQSVANGNNTALGFSTITEVAGGLVTDAWRAWQIRVLTGASAGRIFTIAANTAGVYTLVTSNSSAITAMLAGDTFVVERPAAVFSVTSRINLWGTLALYNLRFVGAGGVGFDAVMVDRCSFESSSIGGTSLSTSRWLPGALVGAASLLPSNPAVLPYSGIAGCAYISTTISVAFGSYFRATSAVFSGCAITITDASGAFLQTSQLFSNCTVAVDRMSRFIFNIGRFTGNTALAISAASGSMLSLTALDISNSTAGAANLIKLYQSTGVFTTVTGASNLATGTAVLLDWHSDVQFTNPATAGTILAAGGAVKVGNNAAEANWTAIDAGTPANVTDVAAAGGTHFCSIHK